MKLPKIKTDKWFDFESRDFSRTISVVVSVYLLSLLCISVLVSHEYDIAVWQGITLMYWTFWQLSSEYSSKMVDEYHALNTSIMDTWHKDNKNLMELMELIEKRK